jgi:hypothetical protein
MPHARPPATHRAGRRARGGAGRRRPRAGWRRERPRLRVRRGAGAGEQPAARVAKGPGRGPRQVRVRARGRRSGAPAAARASARSRPPAPPRSSAPTPLTPRPTPPRLPPHRPRSRSRQLDALKRYGRDFTEEARRGLLDPVIGRASVMQRVMQVLLRRTKNNPILIGEAGEYAPLFRRFDPARPGAGTDPRWCGCALTLSHPLAPRAPRRRQDRHRGGHRTAHRRARGGATRVRPGAPFKAQPAGPAVAPF